jgi:hypothetical protein
MGGCCCCGSKKKNGDEYECAVNPKKCPTKVVEQEAKAPVCCGAPMKKK